MPEADALGKIGRAAYAGADFRRARAAHERAAALLDRPGQELARARALDQAGMAARQLGELHDARTLHGAALALLPAGPSIARALAVSNLGVVAFFAGELREARALHEQALAMREDVGDVRGRASSLNNLGQVARFEGSLSLARSLMEEGLTLRRGIGDAWGVAGSQVGLAAVLALLGEGATAREHLRAARRGFAQVGDPLGRCEWFEAAAELARAEGRTERAVTLCAAASRLRADLPAPRPAPCERAVAALLKAIP